MRLPGSPVSSTTCFFSSASCICAAIVSASLPVSSSPDTPASASGGTFLCSFTYDSNWLSSERRSASVSSGLSFAAASSEMVANSALKNLPDLSELRRARRTPWTITFTVLSGIFIICSTVARVPTR